MSATSYELHKLGWRAFQDLCAVVLQEVLGQTFTSFADTNDAGQDGAFHGFWTVAGDSPAADLADFAEPAMPVVAQCKFSVDPAGTLTPSDLEEELEKVARLHRRGLCDGYLVLTNLRVTGRTQAWFVEEARKRGAKVAAILPGTWICTQIEKNWTLRRYVPRVYGLGDLSTILDERRIRQARALLTSLTRELETFVPTGAYRSASDAVVDHGFVLLLGEPASGKSTIAAMLCMTALDHWRSEVMRVDGPEDLLAHWNPDEPHQMFWVDDAFGSIRYEPHLANAWVRRMPEVMAAISHGARVLMTSRDYIYREARPRMKEYAFPRLREHQVVIDTNELTTNEKEQMLYNHLKAGDQPVSSLETWRPHLRSLVATAQFRPEVARRLSLQAFTPQSGLRSEAELISYFEHPSDFLVDVLDGLAPAQRAALAAVYISGGKLTAPFNPSSRLVAAVTDLGAGIAETTRAFAVINGTFLSQTIRPDGSTIWQFHHPTVREGFAAAVARDVSTLSVYLEGMTSEEIVSQLDCGGRGQLGTLVRVPPTLYELVVSRVRAPSRWDTPVSRGSWFLRTRCSNSFLRMWAEAHAYEVERMAEFGQMVEAMWEPYVLSKLAEAGALPEATRRKAVSLLMEYAMSDLDPGCFDTDLAPLFTEQEYEEFLRRVERVLLPDLEDRISGVIESIYSNTTKEQLYEPPRDFVKGIRQAFADREDILDRCDEVDAFIGSRLDDTDAEDEPATPGSGLAAPPQAPRGDLITHRDPFEDVAAGH